ncbi:uncharacterized protein Z520_02086 [Fonsecaea multimorphosa CBS 102226]|uniref:Peptidase S8/S53 domain-containing protein n=1 Tax=Fonsecaea multimorphosa CBS 102226 TaxID=1442371 RepID=A0A0D2K7I6_9EURO|nr:uncharacterized protein Z520_02086 [Fonsecaea multimorphosa CBS 102226]KIY01948.1 hypothetical protein Z520_02086 [Fonsecaea multimorphosa CBS 102226]OAL29630.1 hypothetical protein AYO22_02044 [Fonsecaea multimorphosa]
MSSITPPADAAPVEVNGRTINPLEFYARDARNTKHIIVTVRHILSIAEEDELQALGVVIVEDLGDNNFLCYYDPDDLLPIRQKEFVRQVDVYRNLYKIPASLEAVVEDPNLLLSSPDDSTQLTDSTEPEVEIDVQVHEEVNDQDIESLASTIVSKTQISRDEMEIVPGKIRLTAKLSQLVDIAKDDRVRIIEEVLQPVLYDDEARQVVHADNVQVEGLAFGGKGQIVTVADSGFDIGSTEDCHPAFTGKVMQLVSFGRSKEALSDQQKVNDPDGHGTHVCGIVLGQDFETDKGIIGGVAKEASLIVQSLLDTKRKVKPPILPSDLFKQSYSANSRIHSNSWGVPFDKKRGQLDYAATATAIDDFVRNNPEMLVCFSAGNYNVEAEGGPSIGPEAAAKNCITVGASGSTRHSMDKDVPDTIPSAIWPKSSRGPTKEKRLKPDVVAPGFSVYSAKSRASKQSRFLATCPDAKEVSWWPDSGTSMAAPLVAGCAAVLREILHSKGCTKAPAALLKAVILNGADKLPDVDINAQGHGRVNLHASAAMLQSPPATAKDIRLDTTLPLSGGTLIGDHLKQDDECEFVLSLADANDPNSHFKITMVYNDIGRLRIQNNLNLIVIDAITNETRYGNEGSVNDPDTENNVEQIILSTLPKGTLRVKVHAQKILAGQEQDFALAWSTFTPLSS